MCPLVINSQGMGAAVLGTGNPSLLVDCSSGMLQYLTNPLCWTDSFSDWQNAFYGSGITVTPPVAPTAPPAALSDPNSVLGDTSGSISQNLSNQAISQTQGNNAAANPQDLDACQQYSLTWPDPFSMMTCPTMLLGTVAAVVAILLLVKR